MAERVAILQADQYKAAEIAVTLERGLRQLDIELPVNARVLLKPNIVAQNYPGQCTTTHPAVVDAVCRLLADRGNRIVIGDSSAFYQGGHTERGFRTSGIARVAKRYGAELMAFEKGPLKLVPNPGSSVLREILLSSLIDDVDAIINLPKLKTHSFFRMSGAVKNLFGFVPGGAKYEYHFAGDYGIEAFAEKIADIWLCVQPTLSIMDAICGLDGFGPAATGSPRHDGLLLASKNPWALDWIAARCMGFNPEKLPGCAVGLKRGYLTAPERIEIVGDYGAPVVSVWKPAPGGEEKPKAQNGFYRLVAVHPALHRTRCTGCGQCLVACPPGAISWSASELHRDAIKLPSVNLDLCLRCHHCVYACPENAWYLKGDSPFNLPVRALRKIFRI